MKNKRISKLNLMQLNIKWNFLLQMNVNYYIKNIILLSTKKIGMCNKNSKEHCNFRKILN